ncbi:hypothetical protein [Chitinolyticbacter meiyuanensis]|uniref:hypothetical protein n=1 Tax=Chitinolyticbacter meiyuanensis TaxID=682798 RepID=UPI0011E5E16E|nr:hypothetical protein [Chitinolyticbacter meiyuanensis]
MIVSAMRRNPPRQAAGKHNQASKRGGGSGGATGSSVRPAGSWVRRTAEKPAGTISTGNAASGTGAKQQRVAALQSTLCTGAWAGAATTVCADS